MRSRTPGGGQFTAVENITFAAGRGAFVSLVGPSACGKSTILGMVSGLLPPSGGEVRVEGETVQDNVALPLLFRKLRRPEALRRAQAWTARVGLTAFAGLYEPIRQDLKDEVHASYERSKREVGR